MEITVVVLSVLVVVVFYILGRFKVRMDAESGRISEIKFDNQLKEFKRLDFYHLSSRQVYEKFIDLSSRIEKIESMLEPDEVKAARITLEEYENKTCD